MVDTEKKKKKKKLQCGNTGEQILLNEPRKHWHIYKTIFFWNKINNFLLFRVTMVTTSKPNGFGIMVLFYNIIAYSWFFLGNG